MESFAYLLLLILIAFMTLVMLALFFAAMRLNKNLLEHERLWQELKPDLQIVSAWLEKHEEYLKEVVFKQEIDVPDQVVPTNMEETEHWIHKEK